MISFILKRLISLLPVGLGVVAIVSLLIHAVPGDPADTILGPYATAEEKAVLKHDLGLDQPFFVQLGQYYGQLAHGDLGTSVIYRKPVTTLILERLRPTLELACIAMLVAISCSLPLGIISAIQKGKPLDYGAMAFALLCVAIPNFWLGPMMPMEKEPT